MEEFPRIVVVNDATRLEVGPHEHKWEPMEYGTDWYECDVCGAVGISEDNDDG